MEDILKDLPQFSLPAPGELIEGKVIDVKTNTVLVDLDGVMTGIITGREAKDSNETLKSLQPGDLVSATVLEDENEDGMVVLSFRKASQQKTWRNFVDAYDNSTVIEVVAKEANKGGLLLDVDGIKGFIPVSQLAPLHYPRVNGADSAMILQRLEKLVGVTFKVKIINIDRDNGKLILSEKAAFAEERKKALTKLKAGEKVTGTISGVVKFGIFVAFDGLEGLVHISEIAWGHVKNPGDFGKLGDKVEVLVIGIEDEKISLSMKRLVDDPWIEASQQFKVGDTIEGKVNRVTQFGAFVRLTDDINGLIHLSELGDDVEEPAQVVKVGDTVKARIITVDTKEHRIGLSLNLDAKPAAPVAKEEAEEAAPAKAEEKAEITDETAVDSLESLNSKYVKILAEANYKTVGDLRKASTDDLVKLDGIGKVTAEKILAEIGA